MGEGADPHEAKVRQGQAWLQDHLLNHAEGILGEVLAAAPGHASARRLRGIALYKLGRRDAAIAEIAASAAQAPDNPRAWGDLAVALRDDGQAEAAETAYARAVAAQAAGAPAPPLA